MAEKVAKKNISNLGDHLGFWLRAVSNQVSHAFSRKVEARGVTVAEWVMLRGLYDEKALAPSMLADRMGMTRGAISKLADRLIAKALVTRSAGQGDRRTQELALTMAGRALVPELSELADGNDAEFFIHLPREDREAIMRIMRNIVARLGLHAPPVD